MNAERIAELKKRAEAGLKNCSFDDSRQFYTDLLAILSDYEAALPLLVAVRKAAPADVDLDTCFIGRSKMFSPSTKAIVKELSAYKAYKAYKERSQPHERD